LALDIWNLIEYYLNPEDFLALSFTCKDVLNFTSQRASQFKQKKLDQALCRLLDFLDAEGCKHLIYDYCCKKYGGILSGSILSECVRNTGVSAGTCSIIIYLPRLEKEWIALNHIRNSFNTILDMNAKLDIYVFDEACEECNLLKGHYITPKGIKFAVWIFFTGCKYPASYMSKYGSFSYDKMYTDFKTIVMPYFWTLCCKSIMTLEEPYLAYRKEVALILEKYIENGYVVQRIELDLNK